MKQDIVLLLSRLLMAAIFLFSGYNKATNVVPTQQFMQHIGLPGMLAYAVILLELGGGIALVLGAYTRAAAFLLAGFCLLTAFLVHFQPGDPGQMLHFLKNSCMAGGFLALSVQGGGRLSLGHKLKLRWS
ncbi:MAG TPA: DoxX family protein [Gammaproteobacteria bacterium]|nr:DoxX family protein [Gammaproteobacteria bacterium]